MSDAHMVEMVGPDVPHADQLLSCMKALRPLIGALSKHIPDSRLVGTLSLAAKEQRIQVLKTAAESVQRQGDASMVISKAELAVLKQLLATKEQGMRQGMETATEDGPPSSASAAGLPTEGLLASQLWSHPPLQPGTHPPTGTWEYGGLEPGTRRTILNLGPPSERPGTTPP
mmetsp:Transcript_8717/g.19145  ORF Transcript_8717/g.19145 Transcript_8717/m.19145 type:complete len:172 (+) Transcript_8717:992-1507(+)